jgi:hypothetical protein
MGIGIFFLSSAIVHIVITIKSARAGKSACAAMIAEIFSAGNQQAA